MKNTTSLLEFVGLLLLSIALFSWYAAQKEPFKPAGFTLKQGLMQRYFTQKPLQHKPVLEHLAADFNYISQEAAAVEMQEQAQKKAVILDRSQQHILLTGDSMVGSGIEIGLRKLAAYNGHKLTAISFESTTTPDWSTTKRLDSLINLYEPTYIILSLGSNELFTRGIETFEPYVKDIVKQAGSVNLIWVGPPNWKEDTGINRLIEKVIGRDRFFPSYTLELSRLPDGIHVDGTGSIVWAKALGDWVMGECKHKIVLTAEEPAPALNE